MTNQIKLKMKSPAQIRIRSWSKKKPIKSLTKKEMMMGLRLIQLNKLFCSKNSIGLKMKKLSKMNRLLSKILISLKSPKVVKFTVRSK